MKILQPHPDPQLQRAWNCAQFGLLLLPISPLLAGVSFLLAIFDTWQKRHEDIRRQGVFRGFGILAIAIIITAVFAADKEAAFLGLFNFLPFFVFFAAFGTLIETPAQLRRMAWILAIGSVPVAIIGLGQIYWGWTGPVKLWLIVDWAIEPTGTPPGRMASVFAYANVLASYFLIPFILGLGLWFESFYALRSLSRIPKLQEMLRDPRDPRVVRLVDLNATEDRAAVWQRWLFLSAVVLGNGLALILTNSRNAWAIAILACLAFALYRGWRWLVALVASGAGAILWSAFGPEPPRQWLRAIVPAYFWLRLSDELYPNRPVETLRATQWQFAWQMAMERPWTGWGLRNFTPVYEAQMQLWLGHPHNLFLMLAAETGIPATLLLCGLVGWVLARGLLFLRQEPATLPTETRAIAFLHDRLIFFTYLVAFSACTLFHLLDVTLFDSRINILGWLLLAAIYGIVNRRSSFQY
ncbi:MAG: O-antigen ligase family protein [Oscillatoria sp. SIO1A7]|nr:O-antigen ligase family protein [Oscillatoria sp. SIO1A7]